MDVVNFQKYKTPRKDGTIKYGTWCVLCKANYNNDYMRRRREDPAFREKENAYHASHTRKLKKYSKSSDIPLNIFSLDEIKRSEWIIS